MFSNTRLILLALTFLTLLTRFVHLGWGGGYYFHPDENNMASAITNLSPNSLNPNFFAYGQFPLYLAYFSAVAFNYLTSSADPYHLSFPQAIITLRFYSAFFSSLSIFVLYFLSKEIFKDKQITLLTTIIGIFLPGLIQLAHFGTTESLLVFVFISNIYLSILLYFKIAKTPIARSGMKRYKFSHEVHTARNQTPTVRSWVFDRRFSTRLLLLSTLIGAIGIATKVTALTLITPILFVSLLHPLSLILYLIATLSLSVFFSPYNFIDFPNFISSMRYETSVAVGVLPVFYTQQFKSTFPYLFQLKSIFPYALGLPVFILSVLALFLLLPKLRTSKTLSLYFSSIVIPSVLYFLYQGQLYVKWYRFMSPLFVLSPLLIGYLFSRLRHRLFRGVLILVCILPGISFIRIYPDPDIRLTANGWITANIPSFSNVMTESGNVIDLPIHSSYHTNSYDFYHLADHPEKVTSLYSSLEMSDWIIVPSRRVFKNFATPQHSLIERYYNQLFSGNLGFVQVAVFDNNYSFLLSDEDAEETFSVFDHPVIRIFQKKKTLNFADYRRLISDDSQN